MHSELPEDLVEARELLESGVQRVDPIDGYNLFRDAFATIGSYLEQDRTGQFDSYAKNLKLTYTRRIAHRVAGLNFPDYNSYEGYALILFLVAKQERSEIVKIDESIRQEIKSFIKWWRDELVEDLQK